MITLKDVAIADVTYNPFRTEGNQTVYIGPEHSDIYKDQLVLSSTAPKRVANSFGNRRSVIKLLRAVVVATPDGGTEVKDAKMEINVSIPVGISDEAFSELQARLFSLQDSVFDAVAETGQTQF